MIKTGLYARISDDDPPDDDDRTSIVSQKADGEEVAKRYGLKLVETYEDRETAGAEKQRKSQRRPGFLALMEAARAGQIDAVLVRDIDRLGRDAWTAYQFEELERDRPEFQVYTTRYGLVNRDQLDDDFAYAKKERRRIAARTDRGLQAALARGELPGATLPIGYKRSDENKPEVHEGEAAIVKQVLQWYVDGVSMVRMARRLNQDVRYKQLRRGKYSDKWTRAVCNNIINRRQFYADGKKVYKRGGKSFPFEFDPIISPTLLKRVNERREQNKKKKGGHQSGKHFHLLRGMIKCPCGWTMCIRFDKRSPNAARYRCSKPDHGKKRDPRCPKSYPMRKIETDVWRAVEEIMFDPDRLREVVGERLAAIKGEAAEHRGKLKKVESQLEKLEAEKAWVISNARTQLLASDELEHQLTEVRLNQSQLEAQREDLRVKVALADETIQDADVAMDTITKDVELHTLLTMDLTELKAEKGGKLPVGLDFTVLGYVPTDAETGKPVKVDAQHVAMKLGAAAYIEECGGDWAQALRKAQYEKRREILQHYVRSVLVYVDDAGEKRVKIEVTVPLTGDWLADSGLQPIDISTSA